MKTPVVRVLNLMKTPVVRVLNLMKTPVVRVLNLMKTPVVRCLTSSVRTLHCQHFLNALYKPVSQLI